MADSYNSLSKERKKLQEQGSLPDWYTTGAWQMFKSSYATKGEDGVRGRFKTIAKTLSEYLPEQYKDEYNQKFYEIMDKGWFSPSSPVLANCGTGKGFTISCSGGVVGDSIDSFYAGLHEQAILSKYGFGCSADMSQIRARGSKISKGGKASGVVPVVEDFATMASKVSQAGNRRGSTASYVDIETQDFDELIAKIEHSPDGLNVGWSVGDVFVKKLLDNDPEAQRRYQQSIYTKLVTGKGYFFFKDKVNRARPEWYKKHGLEVKASNLCSEIALYADDGEQGSFDSDEGGHSFSCCLSSMNMYKYDEWKDTDAVFVATVFLDCVVSDFLVKSYGINGLQKVHRFTRKGRAIGLGYLGFSSYLQSKMIPYESLDAFYLNDEIVKVLDKETTRASKWLAKELGEPYWMKGTGQRFTHRLAFAPNKSTAVLMGGVSESFSPDPAMVWTQASAVGEIPRIAPEFLKLLKKKGLDNDAIKTSIIQNMGSCQHLKNELTDHEREVFKNAFEVDQRVLLRYAAHRQANGLDQMQSVNLFVSEDGDEDRIAALHSEAFLNENIHSLYYIYSRSGATIAGECVACSA